MIAADVCLCPNSWHLYLKSNMSRKQLAHVGVCDLAVYNGMLTGVQVNILPQMGKTIGDGSPKSNGSNGASAMPSLQTRQAIEQISWKAVCANI